MPDEPATDADEDTRPERPTPTHARRLLATLRDRARPDAVVDHAAVFGDLSSRGARGVARRRARSHETSSACDYLSFISGIDWQPAPSRGRRSRAGTPRRPSRARPRRPTAWRAADGRFQVFARLQSTRARISRLTLKTDVDEADPSVASWVARVPRRRLARARGAGRCSGSTSTATRRCAICTCPSEFEGHPLRKDFPLLARGRQAVAGSRRRRGHARRATSDRGGDQPRRSRREHHRRPPPTAFQVDRAALRHARRRAGQRRARDRAA